MGTTIAWAANAVVYGLIALAIIGALKISAPPLAKFQTEALPAADIQSTVYAHSYTVVPRLFRSSAQGTCHLVTSRNWPGRHIGE